MSGNVMLNHEVCFIDSYVTAAQISMYGLQRLVVVIIIIIIIA